MVPPRKLLASLEEHHVATMPDTALLESQMPPPPAPKKVLWAAGLLFAACLGALGWLGFQGRAALGELAAAGTAEVPSTLVEPFDAFLWRTLLLTLGSAVLATLTLAKGFVAWRRRWHRQWHQQWRRQLQSTEQEWREKTVRLEQRLQSDRAGMEKLLAEAEAELQKKQKFIAELARQNAHLETELDQRKKAEQSLSQQRQLLESSKAVLEMHVQARTREIHTLKHRYELILNSAGEGICGFDVLGKATFVNPAAARLAGLAVAEMLGKTERELFQTTAVESEATSPSDRGEGYFVRKDGSRFPVEFMRTGIEENGHQTGTVLIFRDISERKRAAETLNQRAAELARSNAELEQFAFVASHDLQEPLRKIQAFGDRLKTKCNGALAPEALDYLERMQSASARMRTLIDDLLTFSRVVRNAHPFVQVDLAQITREVLSDLETRIEKTHAQVEVGELPKLEADATQMRQLLLNLVGNALKFQPPGGQPLVKIFSRTFAAASGEEFCDLTVQDNGIGFEEKYAEKIFVVFQRLHGRGEYEGTGIGLAVCRRIADRHHGTIIARSQPGQGATFVVTLPLRQALPKAAA